uniref:DNA binding protein n=1 Tax=Zea mays TaxID=4577 RepID=B6SGV5_MAIZE|nr:DNA binding protein [Zea mays]
MALEAVVLSQQGSRFGCGAMAAGGPWSGLFFSGMEGVVEIGSGAGGGRDVAGCSPPQLLQEPAARALPVASSVGSASGGAGQDAPAALAVTATAAAGTGRRKRRRMRPLKNEEEVESQRMVHIAVERNRRKQMNEYLAALRSLMPPAYTQRGDQASIVGGAINFVKELEQLLQSLEAQQRRSSRRQGPACAVDPDDAGPFADFFTFPQYSMCAAAAAPSENPGADADAEQEASGSKPSGVADVEATMVESHANLRVLSRRRPRQLLRLVLGLQGYRLTVLHLNMSSAGHMVLYSFSLKVEDDCPLTSVDEIAGAAHQIVEKINEEQGGGSLE